MKLSLGLCCLLLGFLSFSFAQETVSPQQEETRTPTTEKSDDIDRKGKPATVDVTKQVRDFNNPKKFLGPPTTFRSGHVKPRELAEEAITITDDGFTIQLPSKAPIPTITHYNGRIYASGGFHSKEFYCFNESNGALVWAIDIDDDGPSSAVCEDGICVFNTESCTIFAVDSSTGEHKWSKWLGDPLMSTPTIANGKVFTAYPASGRFAGDGGGAALHGNDNPVPQIGPEANNAPKVERKVEKPADLITPKGQSHVLCCLDLKTGKILWQRWIDSDVMTAPIADGDELFVTSLAGTVYKYKQADGEIISAQKLRATAAPLVVKGKIIVPMRSDDEDDESVKEVTAIVDRDLISNSNLFNEQEANYLDRQVQLESQLAQEGQKLDAGNGFGGGPPAAANAAPAAENIGQANVSTLQAYQGSRNMWMSGRMYCCPGDSIRCNDASGKELWSIELNGDIKKVGGMLAAPPISAGGRLLVSTLAGEVLQLDADKGKIETRYKIGSPLRFPPIAQGGNIYVGTQDGKVVCVKTKNKQLTGWTTWGGNSAHNKTK